MSFVILDEKNKSFFTHLIVYSLTKNKHFKVKAR